MSKRLRLRPLRGASAAFRAVAAGSGAAGLLGAVGVLGLLSLLVAAGCTAPRQMIRVSSPSTAWQADPAAALLLANPTYWGARLSPDGSKIAAIRSSGQEDAIVLFSGADFREVRVLETLARGGRGAQVSRRIRMLGWPGDDGVLYSIETALRSPEDGIEVQDGRTRSSQQGLQRGIGRTSRKSRIYRVELDGESRYLARRWDDGPESQFQDRVFDWLLNDPDHFLIEFEGKAVSVHARTGARRTLRKGRTFDSSWLTDHTGTLRAVLEFEDASRNTTWRYRHPVTERWVVATRYDRYTESGFDLAGFVPGSNFAYAFSTLSSERAALQMYDLERGELGKVIAVHPQFDLDSRGLWLANRDGRLLAIEYMGKGLERVWADRDFERSFRPVMERFPDDNVWVVNSSADDTRLLLRVESPTRAPEVYVYDRRRQELIPVFEEYPKLEGLRLQPMEPFVYRARDGLPIPGYVTRPADTSAVRPAIVIAHDGPEGRVDWGFDPVVQFLAARGFTVLQPNFRGSAGFGKGHLQLGDGELGRGIQNDLVDGANAIVAEGLADPERIGIYGVGYGGFSALNGVIETPERFAAAASYGALTDLETYEKRRRSLYGAGEVDEVILGDGAEYRSRREALSPALNAERVRRPLLMAHGSQDPFVNPVHLDLMAKALDREGREFEALLYEGQIRHFIDDRARIDFYSRMADFFERTLTPRAR